MRIGIFGGTFDPIHYGHLVLAEQCREQCRLDEVWFVPAAHPPHKQDASISVAQARCDMIEFAISGNPHFKLCRAELERAGTSYTYMTLDQIHEQDPSYELFLLIGADSLRDLPTWREPQRIVNRATIVAVNRGDEEIEKPRLLLDTCPEVRLTFAWMPPIGISALDLRRRVYDGRTIRYQVPRAVETYIHQHKLYVG